LVVIAQDEKVPLPPDAVTDAAGFIASAYEAVHVTAAEKTATPQDGLVATFALTEGFCVPEAEPRAYSEKPEPRLALESVPPSAILTPFVVPAVQVTESVAVAPPA
jgi:hypothetical protein